MKLWVARHGDAGVPLPTTGVDPSYDRYRPLSDLGQAQVRSVANMLAECEYTPRVIVCSEYERARQTAELFGYALGIQVAVSPELNPFTPAKAFIQKLLDSAQSKRVMIVGHHDNLTPALSAFGGDMGECASDGDKGDGDFPALAKAEVRFLSIDRETGEWECNERLCPSDVAMEDEY